MELEEREEHERLVAQKPQPPRRVPGERKSHKRYEGLSSASQGQIRVLTVLYVPNSLKSCACVLSVERLVFRVQGSGFRVQGSGLRVSGFRRD